MAHQHMNLTNNAHHHVEPSMSSGSFFQALGTTPSTSDILEVDTFGHLYPAIVQVFVVILSGYVCGRSGMVSDVESQGLNTFVSKFALPCMLFRAMATLDFTQVNWTFLSCILISKAVVFSSVLLLSLILSSKPVQYGRAGIFAIFASQSNDFALGYPIVEALYRTTHPELLQYIYLVAPISLLILNPIGFCLLEKEKEKAQRARNQGSPEVTRRKCLRTAWNIGRGIGSNPINFMTFIGVTANLVFSHKIPAVLDGILNTFGSAFSASALFYLGLKMVGRAKAFSGFRLVIPALLIITKLLLFPLITRAVIEQLIYNKSSSLLSEEYANFGFLYGTIPAAPTVFVFATQYNKEVDTIGTALVLSTFISGPWMFVSSQMLSITSVDVGKYTSLLSKTQLDIGILGAVCLIWVAIVLICSKRWRRVPHCFTLGLITSQFLACFGMLLWRLADASVMWQHYIQFFIFLTGVLGARMWTAAIAVALWLLNSRSLCFVLRFKSLFYLVCFGFPVCLTGVLVIFGAGHHRQIEDVNPAFHYGMPQVLLSAVVLTVCFLITTLFLVLSQIARRKRHLAVTLDADDDQHDEWTFEKQVTFSSSEVLVNRSDPDDGDGQALVDDLDIEDCAKTSPNAKASNFCEMDITTSRRVGVRATCAQQLCPLEQRRKCRAYVRTYAAFNYRPGENHLVSSDPPGESEADQYQQNHHVVILLCLATSMVIGMFLCFWRIFVHNSTTTGIFIELELLDGVLMFGQGCFVFAAFGLDTQFVIMPCYRRLLLCLRKPQANGYP